MQFGMYVQVKQYLLLFYKNPNLSYGQLLTQLRFE